MQARCARRFKGRRRRRWGGDWGALRPNVDIRRCCVTESHQTEARSILHLRSPAASECRAPRVGGCRPEDGFVGYGRPRSRAVWRRMRLSIKTLSTPNTTDLRPECGAPRVAGCRREGGFVGYGCPRSRAVWRRMAWSIATPSTPNTPNLRPECCAVREDVFAYRPDFQTRPTAAARSGPRGLRRFCGVRRGRGLCCGGRAFVD